MEGKIVMYFEKTKAKCMTECMCERVFFVNLQFAEAAAGAVL